MPLANSGRPGISLAVMCVQSWWRKKNDIYSSAFPFGFSVIRLKTCIDWCKVIVSLLVRDVYERNIYHVNLFI